MAAGSFSYISSPGGSSSSSSSSAAAEVEALIAEAADLVTLKQIARLNTCHLADDVLLPADVESRFRRLKTFSSISEKRASPATPKRCSSDKSLATPALPPAVEYQDSMFPKSCPSVDKDANFRSSSVDTVSPVKPGGEDRPVKMLGGSETRTNLSSCVSPTASPSLSYRGVSPPSPRRRGCCFGFSPRKDESPRKNGGRDRIEDVNSTTKAGCYGSLLQDSGTFSARGQRRSMRRAMKEEEKVLREAQRMVRLMKQASARMEVSAAAVNELLSELEDEGEAKDE